VPLSSREPARQRQLANLRDAPPAPPAGNTRSMRHGGRATAKTLPVAGKARAIYDELASETPLRDGDGALPAADRVAVEMLALCLCRIESIAAHLELVGILDEHGEPRSLLELERRLRAEAGDHCRQLGLTPRARVAIGLDFVRGKAVDLATLLSEIPEPVDGESGG
jgi:hypothetical protein